MAKFLDEKGVVDFDPENFEDSEEGLAVMVESKVKTEVEKWKKSLGDQTLALVDYLENGGKIEKFFEFAVTDNYAEISDDKLEDDLKLQQRIVKDLLKKEGYTDEEVEEELQEYEDSGILLNKAKRAKNKLVTLVAKEKEAAILEQRKEREAETLAHQQWLKELKSDLEKREEIAGFKIEKKQKDDFYAYITAFDRKTGKTAFMKDADADPEAQLKMAWLFYNKFDFSKVKQQAKKEVSSKLRDSLSRMKTEGKGFKSAVRTNHTQEEGSFSLFSKSL
jgi:hypothetical protein